MNIIFPINIPLCNKLILDLTLVKFAHALSKKHKVYVIYSGKVSEGEIEQYYNIDINANIHFLSTYRVKFFKPFKLSISQVSKWHIAKHIYQLTRGQSEWIIYSFGKELQYYLKKFQYKKTIKFICEVHAISDLPRYNNISLITTTTNALKEKIIANNKQIKKVQTLYLPVSITEIDLCNYQTNYDTKTLIYTGKLHSNRGFYMLLDSLYHLDNEYQLEVFGGIDREIQAAKNYCKQHQINHKITFYGYLPVAELSKKIASIKGIIIVPPLNIGGYNEIAHTKASDGLAMGRVMVVSDLSSIREIVPAENSFFIAGSAVRFSTKNKGN